MRLVLRFPEANTTYGRGLALRNPHVFISDDGVVCRLLFILLQEQGIDATLVTSPERNHALA